MKTWQGLRRVFRMCDQRLRQRLPKGSDSCASADKLHVITGTQFHGKSEAS